MVNYRIFCVSDDLFSGFETRVDLDEVANVDEIVKEVIEQLLKVLYENKLDILHRRLFQTKFHIHDYTFEDILLSESSNRFYVCGHC